MSRLSAAQVDRTFCKLIGLSHFVRDNLGSFSEISCTYDLELMEKFNDFSYVSAKMFKEVMAAKDASAIEYSMPELPQLKIQECIDTPLDPYSKICLERSLSSYLQDYYHRLGIKTSVVMPKVDEYLEYDKKQRALEKKAEEEAKKAEEEESAQSEDDNATETKDESAESKDIKEVATESDSDSDGDESELSEEELKAKEEERKAEDARKMREFAALSHRYDGRKLKVRFISGWNNSFSSQVWAFTLIKHQLTIVDDGITDMLRDVIVYEWFDKLSDEDKAKYNKEMDLEAFYKALQLTDYVIFPDGKGVLWYSLNEPMLGEGIDGIGVDIDPPYKRNYAVGIKHVYVGKLEQHPTLNMYRKLLGHEGLKQLARSVHYCPSDNISPFSPDETSAEMVFINDAYIIVDVNVDSASKQQQFIEVMIKVDEELDLDQMVARLTKLKSEYLDDLQSLVTEVVGSIAEPLAEMKNEQEARRRARDSEYTSYLFKDNMHRSDISADKLISNYNLSVERVVLGADNSLKLIMPSNLFAFIDKDDDKFQDNGSLGMVHADAVVVTLNASVVDDNGEERTTYDIGSIDLADCVQIPFGMHQNQDADVFAPDLLTNLLSDAFVPIDPTWVEVFDDHIGCFNENHESAFKSMRERQKEMSAFYAASRNKAKETHKRLRQERKKKKKMKK